METESKESPKLEENLTINFDEFNYDTWFKSNEIKRNLCTFVPFVYKLKKNSIFIIKFD